MILKMYCVALFETNNIKPAQMCAKYSQFWCFRKEELQKFS
jgi:hypothetical protein